MKSLISSPNRYKLVKHLQEYPFTLLNAYIYKYTYIYNYIPLKNLFLNSFLNLTKYKEHLSMSINLDFLHHFHWLPNFVL